MAKRKPKLPDPRIADGDAWSPLRPTLRRWVLEIEVLLSSDNEASRKAGSERLAHLADVYAEFKIERFHKKYGQGKAAESKRADDQAIYDYWDGYFTKTKTGALVKRGARKATAAYFGISVSAVGEAIKRIKEKWRVR